MYHKVFQLGEELSNFEGLSVVQKQQQVAAPVSLVAAAGQAPAEFTAVCDTTKGTIDFAVTRACII